MSKKGHTDIRLLTVGHGTLSRGAFADLLVGAGVESVVDVRRFPGSRRHPQFGRAAMEQWLPAAGVVYRHAEALGGRRKPAPDSPNDGLRNAGFRAYADHMASAEFHTALHGLLEEGTARRTAVLCAESVWWRCHRRLLADALVLLAGAGVEHLFHDGRAEDHPPTEGVRIEGGVLVYAPAAPPRLPGL